MNTATKRLRILVNDQARDLDDPASLLALVQQLGLVERKGVAVAVNDSVVPRNRWDGHTLAAGDRVLVIQATQGG